MIQERRDHDDRNGVAEREAAIALVFAKELLGLRTDLSPYATSRSEGLTSSRKASAVRKLRR